jgi:hypothetical protein
LLKYFKGPENRERKGVVGVPNEIRIYLSRLMAKVMQ